ncbi:MAG: hypothetical protein IKR25_12895 [Muribaculaceae bacterium]|nr:hypothetical protein [Muribaculaceae bacterium]
MTKRILNLGVLLLCMLACVTLSSCGSDDNKKDEPTISNVRPADLTTPWMIINAEEVANEEFSFLAFDGNRAAHATMNENGVRNITIYDSWKVDGDKLYLGGHLAGTIKKGQSQGIQVIFINEITYVPSNVKVDGSSIEDEFIKGGVTREMIWQLLEQGAE